MSGPTGLEGTVASTVGAHLWIQVRLMGAGQRAKEPRRLSLRKTLTLSYLNQEVSSWNDILGAIGTFWIKVSLTNPVKNENGEKDGKVKILCRGARNRTYDTKPHERYGIDPLSDRTDDTKPHEQHEIGPFKESDEWRRSEIIKSEYQMTEEFMEDEHEGKAPVVDERRDSGFGHLS
ncbi:hypothetical protein BGX21_006149 [Mortierella sp. AD011]|nr:hypothetical protein BGX20_004779 [Mortierella sp. AD010]KAF9399492.1 hypothetical protein BGX21_006149 [Mortierella sp. AD011]